MMLYRSAPVGSRNHDCVGRWPNLYLLKHPEHPRVSCTSNWMAPNFSQDIGATSFQREPRGILRWPGAQEDAILRCPQRPPIQWDRHRAGQYGFPPRLALINPHTSFFRSELQAERGGANVYGAATWGQFFIYQVNDRLGGWYLQRVDAIDEYAETITRRVTACST